MEVSVVASITPVVSKSRLLIAKATVVVSEIVTLSSRFKPVIVPAPFASKLVWTSDIVPLRLVTPLSIVTTPLVFEFSVFISDADTLAVSVVVTFSLPKPLISPAVFALYVVVTSAIVPVKFVTLEASTTPLVDRFSVLSSLEFTFVSLIVTFSSPSIVILLALYTAWTSEILPVKVVTPESTLTTPLVFAARVVISVATTLPVSVRVKASLPSPLISPFVFALYDVCRLAIDPLKLVKELASIVVPVLTSNVFRSLAFTLLSLNITLEALSNAPAGVVSAFKFAKVSITL